MQKILLFDFDGTLADTSDSIVRIYNEIAKEKNYKKVTKENLSALRNKSARENMRDLGIPLSKLSFIARRMRKALRNEVSNFKLIAGIRSSLKLLKGKGCGLYVLSSNSRENINFFLDHNQINEFDGVFSASNFFGKHVKIRHLIKANRWDAASVTYIGDEVRDIDAARKAGIRSVAVSWGYNTQEVLLKNGPDALLRDPAELVSI